LQGTSGSAVSIAEPAGADAFADALFGAVFARHIDVAITISDGSGDQFGSTIVP
jgi:hypothetical protein